MDVIFLTFIIFFKSGFLSVWFIYRVETSLAAIIFASDQPIYQPDRLISRFMRLLQITEVFFLQIVAAICTDIVLL